MWRRPAWLKLRYLPLIVGASLPLISWFYLMWNTTAGEINPSLRFRTKTTIAGVIGEAAPILSLDAVLTGTYQRWVSRSIGQLSPVFKMAVGWKGQIYYSLLGMVPEAGLVGPDSVIVGRDQQLFEMNYLNEYCGRDPAKLQTAGGDWATRICRVQDFFNARGKVFLYIITPSKVAQEPQIIPDRYACPGNAKNRAEKLDLYDKILTRHGVQFVDTASEMTAARETYGVSMFPRGGIHWNSLGSALGTQKVIAAVNAQRPAPLLATLNFTWRISYHPQGSDRDLLDIINLPYPDTHYPVPILTYQSSPPPNGCHTISITEVGGSFLRLLNSTLERLGCPPEIIDWFYRDHNHIRYAVGRLYDLPVDADARRASLLDADVIFLEENDATAPNSMQGELMMREVARLAGTRDDHSAGLIPFRGMRISNSSNSAGKVVMIRRT